MAIMEALPNEILEEITKNLDGVSLVQLKRTCRRFAAVVRRLETELDVWRRQCIFEISDDVFTEIAFAGHPQLAAFANDEDSSSSSFAQVVYNKWYNQRLMNANRQSGRTQFAMFDSTAPSNRYRGCTCMKLSGSRLMTGHGNGSAYIWDIVSGTCLGVLVAHKQTIFDMVLVNFYNAELLVDAADVDHHHVLTVSMDNTMKTVPLIGDDNDFNSDAVFTYTPRIRIELKQARIFRNKVALMWSNGHIQLLAMQLLSAERRAPHKLELLTIGAVTILPEPSRWMSFWNDNVIVVDPILDRYCVPICGDPWSCYSPSFLDDEGAPPSNSPIVATTCNLFRENIVIMRTVSRHVCISVDGIHYRSYATMKDLCGVVTCASINANLLLLGTDYGGLYLYHFETDAHLMNLNLAEPIWTGKVSGGRAVSFVDIKLDEREPILVASDCWSVVVVKWTMPPSFLTSAAS